MDIRIYPRKLSGTVSAVPSKIESGVKLVCAALSAKWTSFAKVENVCLCEDILVLLDALKAIGSKFEVNGSTVVFQSLRVNSDVEIDCRSSKFALMFILPLVGAYARLHVILRGNNDILDDEAKAWLDYFKKLSIRFDYDGGFPIEINALLNSGEHYLKSYSLVPGLIIALAHNGTDSFILVENKNSSRAYAEIAVDALKQAGVLTAYNDGIYIVRGGQTFSLFESYVGGDFSLASNFVFANAMTSNVRVTGLDATSVQSESAIFDIIKNARANDCKGIVVDVTDLISVLPILCVYATTLSGRSLFYNVKSDYSDAKTFIDNICEMINAVGGKATAFTDRVEIEGVKKLDGGVIDAKNNSRIVMAGAILSTLCASSIEIKNCDSIMQDYPTFFDDFRRLGGVADII